MSEYLVGPQEDSAGNAGPAGQTRRRTSHVDESRPVDGDREHVRFGIRSGQGGFFGVEREAVNHRAIAAPREKAAHGAAAAAQVQHARAGRNVGFNIFILSE